MLFLNCGPQAKRRAAQRIVAMVSIGALRVAMETWGRDGGKNPLAKYLRESFATRSDDSGRRKLFTAAVGQSDRGSRIDPRMRPDHGQPGRNS